jgi:hypothetical protein
VALEATGAGRYAAAVPLSRPGTYVATAKDEVSGEAVGTTGAVLTAGEELRPTGSDRVLLSRIAQMTGGKVRDTLAGIYDDRASRRFAYTPLGSPLVLIAAIAMLMGVAARRLGTPAFFTAAAARASALARASRPEARRAAHDAEVARARARADEQARTNALLLDRKRTAAANAPPRGPGILGNIPKADVPPPIVQTALTPPPPQASPGPGATSPERQLTAAERLAQRRRERK